MNLVNSLFIFTTTILIYNFSVAFENNVTASIDNVYIDTLVQRYLALESSLWNQIRNSATKSNELVLKILEKHNDFFTDEWFASVINPELKLKFKEYLIMSVGDDPNNATNLTNVKFNDFNSHLSLSIDLFEEIRRVILN